jgi:hypothetical protein
MIPVAKKFINIFNGVSDKTDYAENYMIFYTKIVKDWNGCHGKVFARCFLTELFTYLNENSKTFKDDKPINKIYSIIRFCCALYNEGHIACPFIIKLIAMFMGEIEYQVNILVRIFRWSLSKLKNEKPYTDKFGPQYRIFFQNLYDNEKAGINRFEIKNDILPNL